MSIDEYCYWQPPTDAHLKALGRVAVESAILENVIEAALWQIMGLKREIGEQITNQPTLHQKLNVLLRIVPHAFPDNTDQQDFTPIGSEMKAVAALRNHLLHSAWAFGTKREEPRTVNHRNEKGEIVPRTKKWRADEIERIAARIGRVGDEFIYFLTTRHVSLPPLPSRPWKQYQMPPEPEWPSKLNRVPPPPRQPFQT